MILELLLLMGYSSRRVADPLNMGPSNPNATGCRFDVNHDPPSRLCLISLSPTKNIDEEQRKGCCNQSSQDNYRNHDHLLLNSIIRHDQNANNPCQRTLRRSSERVFDGAPLPNIRLQPKMRLRTSKSKSRFLRVQLISKNRFVVAPLPKQPRIQ